MFELFIELCTKIKKTVYYFVKKLLLGKQKYNGSRKCKKKTLQYDRPTKNTSIAAEKQVNF